MSAYTPDKNTTEWLFRVFRACRARDMANLAQLHMQLQATIPHNALRAELRRRLEMIRRQRPFPGRSIGTFGGPAQAPAINIKEHTIMATKKIEASPDEVGEACLFAFGEHPEDVISVLDSASETLYQLKEIFETISRESSDTHRLKRLADVGAHIADDIGNFVDCQHEKYRDNLRMNGIIAGAGTP